MQHDWSQINGMDVLTAQTVIAEAGADLSAFPSEKQFTSWLGLCPSNETSSGKILNRRTRKVVNRASVAFRNAASTLVRVRVIWVRNTAVCVPVWALRRPSPPWLES